MCMITYIPANVEIPWEGIYNGASWNEDGHGWALATPDGIHVGKSFDVDQAIDGLYEARKGYDDCPALFHSRWATHGELSERNIHPFFVGKGKNTVLAHNGVLPSAFHPKGLNWRSDTNNFALWLGRHENILSRRGRRVIGEMIGWDNKLVILTNSPIFDRPRGFIVNDRKGDWAEGCWFSNYDHCTKNQPRKYSGVGTGYGKYTGSWSWEDYDDDKLGTALKALPAGSSAKGITETAELVQTVSPIDSYRLAQCPHCGKRGNIEIEANVCLACDWCLDCDSAMRDCMCYWGNNGHKEQGTTEESGEFQS